MAEPTPQQKTLTLECIECERLWTKPSERWRLYLTDEEPTIAVVYCPTCAKREFG